MMLSHFGALFVRFLKRVPKGSFVNFITAVFIFFTSQVANAQFQPVNLGNVQLCSTVTVRINGLNNRSNFPVPQTDVMSATVSGSPDFSLPPLGAYSDDCNGLTMTNSGCYFYITFHPTQSGPQSATISESDSGSGVFPNGNPYSFSATYVVQANAVGVGSEPLPCPTPRSTGPMI